MKHFYKTLLCIGVLSTFFTPNINAQFAEREMHDPHKYKQWRSMENGEWDFAPDYWYWLLHKNYSGAEMYWTTVAGFIPVPHIRFKEEKSNVKRVFIPRAAQLAEAEIKKLQTRTELDTIIPIHDEELKRSLDRNFDLTYAQYKDEFDSLQETINECLEYCILKSNGRLSEVVGNIRHNNDIILSEINYIHKDSTNGLGNELENSKRQIAYEKYLNKMKDIAKVSLNLVAYSKCYY